MQTEPPRRIASYHAFLTADARRRADALEVGHDFTDDAQGRYRVCFYVETGEVTIERLTGPDALDIEDFDTGIASVEVLRAALSRAELDRALGPWPAVERCHPRTLDRLHELLGARLRLRAVR